jgi:hypothetical protein
MLSLPLQTWLAVGLSCAMAALLDASAEGYMAAVTLGVVLGLTADLWVRYIQLS